MKKFVLLFSFTIVLVLFICFGCKTAEKNLQTNTFDRMELSVDPGEHWQGKMKVFIFSVKKNPQMAAWIEDNHGNYISTITVTNRSAKKSWRSAPKEGRPEALPVWNHKNNSVQVDSVSAATSKGAVDIQIDNSILKNGQEYNIYLEINHSFDYNDIWTETNSGVNGQPSLIYHSKFIAGLSGKIELNPMGHGSVDGSDGNIANELDGMTTALTIIKSVHVITN